MSSQYSINYHLRAHKRDPFIEFIKSLLLSPFILSSKLDERYLEILECVEDLVSECIECDKMGKIDSCRLKRLVPSVGRFFTRLPLTEAFGIVNEKRSITSRKFIPPSFNDIRSILNQSQIIAIAKQLKLITFDGDMTLYADGADFAQDSELVGLIVKLLQNDIKVAIVTAAGYPGNAARYEKRLSGLLDGFRNYKKDQQKFKEFYVFGGECNYLFKYNPKSGHLDYIIEDVYQPNFFQEWSKNEEAIQSLLDAAEKHLQGKIVEMGLKERVSILRKSRAIGCNPKSGETLTREQLDELALSTQSELNLFQQNHNVPSKKLKISRSNSIKSNYELDCHIPFCAFNGGSDVWVDIGNKLIGVRILLEWLNMKPNETLHVGDQFLSTGNDIATRTACCTIWITSPQETHEMLVELIKIIEREL